jgi:hypothetical protein
VRDPAGGAAGPGREPEDQAREAVTAQAPTNPGRETNASAPQAEPARQTGAPPHGEPGQETGASTHRPEEPARGAASPAPATATPAHRSEDPSRRPASVPRQKAAPPRRQEDPGRGPAGQGRETRAPAGPGREAEAPPRETVVAREQENPARRASGLAHRIADTVLRCPDVVDLSGGPFGTVATYLPGERLPGVALRENEVEVSVVVRLGRPLPEIADEMRAAVAPMVGDRPVNVHIGGLR